MEFIGDLEQFISDNALVDPSVLRLKYAGKHLPFDVEHAITQIECRRKSRSKLPSLLSSGSFMFPSVLASEQSTGEVLARFHASLIPHGAEVLDMTCGLGVDDIFMSEYAERILTFDILERNAEFAEENFRRLGIGNITVKHGDSVEWLRQNPESKFDVIFADPARRGEFNSRTYALADCSPDIAANLELLKHHTDRLIVKVSPMLDITQLCNELGCVSRLWVLSLKNECKELLVECDLREGATPDTLITAIDFDGVDDTVDSSISFRRSDTLPAESVMDDPATNMVGLFIYEPSSAVIKSGGSAIVSDRYGLRKLHPNTILYVGKEYFPDFPGRVFRINETYSISKLNKGKLKGKRRNIICRNFPIKPAALAASANVREGSDNDYLIGATVGTKKKSIVFDCVRMQK